MSDILDKIFSEVKRTQSIRSMEDLMFMCKEEMKSPDTKKSGMNHLIALSD